MRLQKIVKVGRGDKKRLKNPNSEMGKIMKLSESE